MFVKLIVPFIGISEVFTICDFCDLLSFSP